MLCKKRSCFLEIWQFLWNIVTSSYANPSISRKRILCCTAHLFSWNTRISITVLNCVINAGLGSGTTETNTSVNNNTCDNITKHHSNNHSNGSTKHNELGKVSVNLSSICLSIYLSIWPFIILTMYIFLSISPSVNIYIYQYDHDQPSISLIIYQSVHLIFFSSINLSVYHSFHPKGVHCPFITLSNYQSDTYHPPIYLSFNLGRRASVDELKDFLKKMDMSIAMGKKATSSMVKKSLSSTEDVY